jgi:L-seryl-tRNA(Ser) seleniumtransferase
MDVGNADAEVVSVDAQVLNVEAQVINAAGFVTSLGGGQVSPAVAGVIARASMRCYDVTELARAAGERIARLAGAPAAAVTAGAAAGLVLGVAACITGDDPARADALPVPPGAARVVCQLTQANAYERVVRLTGAQLHRCGLPTRPGLGQTQEWELEAALASPGVVCVLHTVIDDPGAIPLRRVCDMARVRGVPVVVDAAAQLPPTGNLTQFLGAGADLVVFSGGKALRGPQASGLVLGRPDLIAVIRRLQEDTDADPVVWAAHGRGALWQQGIGRAMKVGPETILGTEAALAEFLSRDHSAEAREQESWLSGLAGDLGSWTVIPAGGRAHFYPSLVRALTPAAARAGWHALAACTPSVRAAAAELAAGVLRIRPEAVRMTEREHVRAALERVSGQL